MKTFEVLLEIRAECESDARELINDFTGKETDVEIRKIEDVTDIIEALDNEKKREHIFTDKDVKEMIEEDRS